MNGQQVAGCVPRGTSSAGRKSRTKGAQGEREFISRVYKLTGGEIKLSRNLEQPRGGGADCLHDNFAIEIKRHKTGTDNMLRDWWRQATKNADSKIPVLAYRFDFGSWRVMLHSYSQFFPVSDNRGCINIDLELFCKFLQNGYENDER